MTGGFMPRVLCRVLLLLLLLTSASTPSPITTAAPTASVASSRGILSSISSPPTFGVVLVHGCYLAHLLQLMLRNFGQAESSI